ncbi:hypothetical protein FHR86_003840, partial [Paenarthrobacter ilicis]
WIKIGDGASTEPGQGGFLSYWNGNRDAVWIKGGALQFGAGAANLPAASNSGFVRVFAADGGGVAIKANGEIWRSNVDAPAWIKIGDGASTEPGQGGFLSYWNGNRDAVWIKTSLTCALPS